MKIIIAVPCMDSLDVDFVRSLYALERRGETSLALNPGSLVYASRDTLAEVAVLEKSDYVLWLDSDMVFPADTLIDLLATGKDFVTGLCFRRRAPFNPSIYKRIRMGLPDESVVEAYDDYPSDSLFEIDACGFACVLVKTEMLKAVLQENRTAFQPLPGYGEDISFCIRAKKLGYKLFCDSRVKIGHVGRVVVSEESYRHYREAQSNGSV